MNISKTQHEKLEAFAKHFVEALKTNLFIIDANNQLIVPPAHESARGKLGSSFYTKTFNCDFTSANVIDLNKFTPQGPYFEYADPFGLYLYAIPIHSKDTSIIAYVCLGPILLNKRQENGEYLKIASTNQINQHELIDELQDIRVFSFIQVKSICDLLRETYQEVLSTNTTEILQSILEITLNLTRADSGSIMIIDESNSTLNVSAAKGVNTDTSSQPIKIGEGIAGMAVKDNQSFFISNQNPDSRIQHLLKRPNIRQSAVIPLTSQNRLLGVINLNCTVASDQNINANTKNIEQITNLISLALQ